MRTLDQWKSRLTAVPRTIDCPEMRLLSSRDREPPILVGPGHIDIRSSTDIDFTMYAAPTDGGDAFRRLKRARENPYEVIDQLRLIATDYEGTEWACGWTRPELKGFPKFCWPLTGRLTSLVTQATGPFVSQDSGVELVFQPKLDLPMNKTMVSISSLDGEEIERRRSPGQHTVRVLDSEIKFFYKPSDESLWVTAKTSDILTHPFAENWIGEPLRILLGQLVFPRLVARNLGDGTAQVWLRPSPRRFANSGLASLVGGALFGAPAEFWDLYGNLLKLVAEARNEQGQPNFQPHRITRFYEEIAQATQGSRWVLCMTLASAGEGLAKLLMRPAQQDKKILSSHRRGITGYFRKLVERGALQESNAQAWSAVRNEVMHGNLVSPWATEQEDKHIIALANLVHRLTHELIGEHTRLREQ